MTTPFERTRAVGMMREAADDAIYFLRHSKSKEKVMVPRSILERMECAMRHYPLNSDMQQAIRQQNEEGVLDMPILG